MQAEMDALDAAPRVGRWRCVRLIARGSFGAVYEGVDDNGERAAIKVADGQHPQTVPRFAREVAVMRALPRNPHLVGFYEAGQLGDGQPWVAMELVVGITLREVIHAAPLPEEAVLGVMEQICGALGEVHRMGLSHGDIKPANLMMATEPKPIVKLLDFGLVRDSAGLLRRMERTRKLPTDAFAKELDAGRLMGTPQYLAPEAILDAYLAQDAAALRDPASDVFALGVILSELLTGRAPWPFVPDAWSRNEYIRQTAAYVALRGRVDGLQLARPPNVARELWCIVRSCLASDRNLRYDHAVHIRDALRGYGRRNSLLPRPLFRDRARLVADRITSQIRKRRSRT